MKPVIQIETESRVSVRNTDATAGAVAELEPSFEELVAAIETRAHYVGPVLEQCLLLDHETPAWVLRG